MVTTARPRSHEREERTVQVHAGARLLTAADAIPEDLLDALEWIGPRDVRSCTCPRW